SPSLVLKIEYSLSKMSLAVYRAALASLLVFGLIPQVTSCTSLKASGEERRPVATTQRKTAFPVPYVKPAKASYSRVATPEKVVALTFDDGPHVSLTPRLLDILKERDVQATFYVLGRNVQRHPEIARRIVAEGHEIANHSWSHPNLNGLSL